MNLMPEAMPHIAKQACYICSRRNNVVDLEVFIEGEGVLGICVEHIVEALRAAGLEVEDPKLLERTDILADRLHVVDVALSKANRVIIEMVQAGQAAASDDKTPAS